MPWACAGDVVTAVAMLTLKLLGAAAQYHELESLDYETGEFVVASSGEHDLAFAGERPRLVRNLWYDADPTAARAPVSPPRRPGDARRLHRARRSGAGLPLHRRARRVHRHGLAGGRHPLRGVSLPERPAPQAWTRWCRAGREPSLGGDAGRPRRRVESVARFLGVALSGPRERARCA